MKVYAKTFSRVLVSDWGMESWHRRLTAIIWIHRHSMLKTSMQQFLRFRELLWCLQPVEHTSVQGNDLQMFSSGNARGSKRLRLTSPAAYMYPDRCSHCERFLRLQRLQHPSLHAIG